MLVEILMSTYNGEKFLKEQIDSILSQTHTPIRLVVRDDGSTDHTVAIIQEYTHLYPDKVVLLPFDKNRGAMRSFEYLLSHSTADYCMFADQDDVWLPNKVEHAYLEMMKAEEEFGHDMPIMGCSDLQVVDQDLNLLNPSFYAYSRIAPNYLQTLDQLAVNNYITGCTMIMNAAARKVSLPIGEHALMHDVWVGLAVLANKGKIFQIPTADILYRQHSKNVVGATSLKYNWSYFQSKIQNFHKVVHVQHLNFLQINDLYPMSRFKFLYNRIKYLVRR